MEKREIVLRLFIFVTFMKQYVYLTINQSQQHPIDLSRDIEF